MSDLSLDTLTENAPVNWPKRGRKKEPLPEKLVTALHSSFEHGNTAGLVMPTDNVDSFRNLLSKAGKELNYRIEHHVVPVESSPGYVTYYFRTRTRRKDSDD